jgi:hypothetical protein
MKTGFYLDLFGNVVLFDVLPKLGNHINSDHGDTHGLITYDDEDSTWAVTGHIREFKILLNTFEYLGKAS